MRRILVVDDELSIRNMTKSVLERAGYEVITARNGREAIALLAVSDYDVVLLDITMRDVVDTLRKENDSVLAHTYLLTAGDADALTNLPVRGIIGKPFDFDRLVAETKDCIGH